MKKEKREENKKMNRTQQTDFEITEIEDRIKEETPPTGFYYLKNDAEEEILNNLGHEEQESKWKKAKTHFKELPLTRKTFKGLSESKFIKMTPIQRSSLAHSLAGKDILGASKTGSGKTLCFVIPVLEILYRKKWSPLDGLGALLILPTRELAIQVFEVFKLVGRYHDFSIGLVIGGNSVEQEKESLYKMNILIGTPGRLLQHFTETPYFYSDNLKILVIDEVDRILDEGFEDTLNEIFSYLADNRQSLLFSATLTKSLKKIAKVNTKNTEYININNTDNIIGDLQEITSGNEISLLNKNNLEIQKDAVQKVDDSITPINLSQFYTVVESHEKIDILYSFLKSHKNSKCLVFLNSCKQVRFFYEVFRRLKLGMTFLDLHGKQKQTKRTNIFYSFLQKKNTVLFATDIASRGVDFPFVDWVIQLDCPEDVQTYIHRVGRTARYKSKGNSILFVNPKESKFVDNLSIKNIGAKKIKINQGKMINLQPIIRSILSENSELIHLAQKAIASYIKSIFLQNDKEVFDISSINVEQLALSYGLVNIPELKIMKNSQKDLKNKNRDEDKNFDSEVKEENPKKMSKLQKLKEKIKQKKIDRSKEIAEKIESGKNIDSNSSDEEDDFLQEKRHAETELENTEEYNEKKSKKKKESNNPIPENLKEDTNEYYEKIKKRLEQNMESDKTKEKIRVIEKHKQDRIKRKERDYKKHGITYEENNEDSQIEEEMDSSSPPELEEDFEEEKPNKKVKINLKTSTLEEKEKAAMKLLNKTDNLFI
jgi:ATP-dependent RNA helicase DDX10/DBP4